MEEGSTGSRDSSGTVVLLMLHDDDYTLVCSRHDGTLVLWLRFVLSVPKIPKVVVMVSMAKVTVV